MKHKDKSRDSKALVNLAPEQSYLTSEQINDFLPRDVHSPRDLRATLQTFEGRDIKVLDDVPGESTGADETEPEQESVDEFSESSDPVRLYLKEMGKFRLLTREGEVEVAKRIEAGQGKSRKRSLNLR